MSLKILCRNSPLKSPICLVRIYSVPITLSLLILVTTVHIVLGGARSHAQETTVPPSTRPEIVLQLGHKDKITTVIYAPDGRTLATGSWDQTVKIWNAQTGQLLRTLTGHSSYVDALSYAPDGKTLASAGEDQTIKIWDVRSGRLLRTIKAHEAAINALAYAPDGKTIVSAGGDKASEIWNAQTGELVRTLTGHKESVRAIAYAPDGRTLVTGSMDDSVKNWDAQTGQLLHTLTTNHRGVIAIVYAPDGKTLATGSLDDTVKIWDVQTRKLLRTLTGHQDPVNSLSFTPDGKSLISASADKTIKIWNPQTGQLRQTLNGSQGGITSVSHSPDGKMFASAGDREDPTIKMWNAQTGQLARTLTSQESMVLALAYASDGSSLASGNIDKTIKIWDARSGQLARTLTGHGDMVNTISYAPGGKTLASGSWDRTIKIWNTQTGQLLHTLTGHGDKINAVAHAPDGKTLAGADNNNVIKLWDTQSGQLRKTFPAQESSAESIAYSPDGRQLVGGCWDGAIRIWDARSGELLRTLTGHNGAISTVAYDPNGNTISSGSADNTIKIWDARSGQLRHTLTGHEQGVHALSYAPDSKTLATGSWDQTIKLWDVQAGRLLHSRTGHIGLIHSIAYAPDGTAFASAGDDGTIKIWDKNGESVRATLIALASHDEQDQSQKTTPDIGPTHTNWITLTNTGYYDSSPGAGRYIGWRIGNDLFPVEAYERIFKRSDLVHKALGGENLQNRPGVQQFITGKSIAPQVAFVTPVHKQEVAGQEIEVELTATDDKNVARVELFINGRPVMTKAIANQAKPLLTSASNRSRDFVLVPESHNVSRTFKLVAPIPPGESSLALKAIAYDDESIQGSQEITISRRTVAPVNGDLYVLAVGVSEYKNPQNNLQYAAADARAFTKLWQSMQGKLYRRVIVTELTDKDVTTNNVRSALFKLIETVTPQDSVVVFLSGHGVTTPGDEGPVYYFATHETDGEQLDASALPWTVFLTTLSKVDAKRVLFFLDACHSGQSLSGRQVVKANNERMAELLIKRAGVTVFASSQGQELSWEYDELGHGAFTTALIEGIGQGKADLDAGAGRDGTIHVNELLVFLQSRVRQLTGNRQTPSCPLMRDFGEVFPLAHVP